MSENRIVEIERQIGELTGELAALRRTGLPGGHGQERRC